MNERFPHPTLASLMVFGLCVCTGLLPAGETPPAVPVPPVIIIGDPPKREPVPGNEVVLRVDRYTFTQDDIDATARNYHEADFAELENARMALAQDNPQITARAVRDMENKLERKAISTLVSNVVMAEAVEADVFQEYKKQLAEEYDRLVLNQFTTFEQYMARRHWNKQDVDDDRRRFVATHVRYEVIQRLVNVDNKISVTTAELQEYYKKHASQFTIEKGYRIRVLLLDKDYPHEEANLYKLARQIRQEYLDGGAFDDLARKYSDNRETKVLGGLWICKPLHPPALGSTDPKDEEWVTPSMGNQRNPQWFSAAAALDPTQRDRRISQVLEGATADQKGSYSLVYLEATRPSRLVEYKDVPRNYLSELAQRRKAELEANRWTNEKLSGSRIEYRGKVVPFSEFWSKDLED